MAKIVIICNNVLWSRWKWIHDVILTTTSRLSEEAGFRKPRFFFVTTSSVTETLRTNSLCYVTAGAGFSGECKRRKKRSLFRTGRLPWYDAVQPTKLTRGDEEEYSLDESSSYEADGREGRFLLYWITTTSRSTTTIYSSTYSVHSVECTPNPANLC